jgi:FkbM family methyltransferase
MIVGDLQVLQVRFSRPPAEPVPFNIAFDLSYPTQGLIHRCLAGGQLCDPPLVTALVGFLTPGDTFIDVGSHIGYYSLLARQVVGTTGRVLAFEPNPETFGTLVANGMLNGYGNFYAYNCAMGDRYGSLEFNINVEDEGMSSLVFRSARSSQIKVHVTTLDIVVALSRLQNVRMLKIDVEGFEENVIAGAKQLISGGGVESIVFELNNNIPGVTPHRDQAIRKHLSALGYTSYLIRPWLGEEKWQEACGKYNFYRVADDSLVEIKYGNILATKRQIEAANQ